MTSASRSPRASLLAYASIAVATRSATEALGPALLLTAIASGRTATEGAVVLAGLMALAALSGPLVGALLDRAAKPGHVIAMSVAALAVVVAAMSVLLPRAPIPILVVIAMLGGLAYPAIQGGLTSQLPSMVSGSMLDRAYAIDASTYNIGAIVGPPLAAAAVILGAPGPVLFTLVLLLCSLVVIRRVPFAVRPHRIRGHSLRRDLVTGFHALGRTTSLAVTTLITTIGHGGQAAFLVAVPLVALKLTGSLAMSGAAFGAEAAGGIAATLLLARRPFRHPDLAVVTMTGLIGLSLGVMAVTTSFTLLVVASVALGAGNGPMITAMFRIRARESAPEVRAQVFTTGASVRTTIYAAMTAAFGAMVALGPHMIFAVGAGLQVAALAGGAIVAKHGTGRALIGRAAVEPAESIAPD